MEEYAEEGVSAYHAGSADRDVLQDVIRAAARHQFDVLLVFKADRLSRQALEYPVLLAQLQRAGVTVISVADSPGGRALQVEGQFDKLLRFIEGWQAETESYNTSIRVSAAMEQMARQGRWTGGTPPYGLRYTPGRAGAVPLEIEPDEADLLRRMYHWYLDDGLGSIAMATRLNDAGYRARQGGPWSAWQVRRVMQNPAVTGRLPYGRKKLSPRGNRIMKPRREWDSMILGPLIPALAIVSVEEYEAVLDRMGAYNRAKAESGPHHTRADLGALLFTGMARCAGCGGPLVVKYGHSWVRTKTRRYKIPRLQYVCLTSRERGPAACPGQHNFSQAKVEGALVPAILRMLGHLDRDTVVAEARRIAEQSLFQRRTRGELVRRQLAEARRVQTGWLERLDRFLVDPERSLYSEAVLAERVGQAEHRVVALTTEVEQADAAEGALASQLADLEEFLADTQAWWAHFLDAPRPRQKALLSRVVDHVVIGRDGFEIHYRIDLASVGDRATGPALEWHTAHGWQAG